MTIHVPPIPEGARPAARFAEAGPVERVYVWALRHWLDGALGQSEVWRHFSGGAGARPGAKALSLFERQLGLVAAHASRPLLRHAACCGCVGRDEAALAAMVALAGEGALEAAYAVAAPLIRQAGLMEVVEASAKLGQALTLIGGEPRA